MMTFAIVLGMTSEQSEDQTSCASATTSLEVRIFAGVDLPFA
jgi:hypothetical protein